jgi:hypothetical protein
MGTCVVQEGFVAALGDELLITGGVVLVTFTVCGLA